MDTHTMPLLSCAQNRSSSCSYWRIRVYSYALLATINSVLAGYAIGVMSGAVLFIKDELHLQDVQEEVLVGSLNVVSALGSLIAGRVADSIGRPKALLLAAAISLLGTLQMCLASSFAVLLCGRIVAGVGAGFCITTAPLYISEVSPAAIRGMLVSLPEVFINVGILMGYIANYLLADPDSSMSWRLMLGFGGVPAVLVILSVALLPESPRWLVLQNRTHDAEAVLHSICANTEEALLTLSQITSTADFYADELHPCSEAAAGTDLNANWQSEKNLRPIRSGSGVWRELLCPSPAVQRLLVISLGLQIFQQASGIEALVYYTPTVLNQSGKAGNAGLLGATIAVGISKTLCVLVATLFLDTVGRRPLLLASSLGMSACMAVIGASMAFMSQSSASTVNPSQQNLGIFVAFGAICAFMAFFAIGFGPTCSVIASEIFPSRLRAQALSVGIVLNRIVSGSVAFTFLSISNLISPATTFFIFAGICTASVVFIYFCIPETKGKSLEELS